MSQKRGQRAGSREGEADTSPAIQNNRSPLLLKDLPGVFFPPDETSRLLGSAHLRGVHR